MHFKAGHGGSLESWNCRKQAKPVLPLYVRMYSLARYRGRVETITATKTAVYRSPVAQALYAAGRHSHPARCCPSSHSYANLFHCPRGHWAVCAVRFGDASKITAIANGRFGPDRIRPAFGVESVATHCVLLSFLVQSLVRARLCWVRSGFPSWRGV